MTATGVVVDVATRLSRLPASESTLVAASFIAAVRSPWPLITDFVYASRSVCRISTVFGPAGTSTVRDARSPNCLYDGFLVK